MQSISPHIQTPGLDKIPEILKFHYRMPLPEVNYAAVLDGILSNSSATGLGDAYYQVIEQSRQDLARLLKSLDPQDLADDQPHLPSNLRGMVSSRRELEPLLLNEGLALAYVPDAEIIDETLSALWPRVRRDIIGQNWTSIVHRCDNLLDSLDDPELQENISFAKCITTALLAGHAEAAQALAANLLDSMLRQKHDGKANISKMKRKQRPLLTRGKQITESIVMAGLWGAFGTYRPDKGDEIPTIFSRHASAHGVSHRQYSQTNAVIALMHVVAYLCWLQHREDVASAA